MTSKEKITKILKQLEQKGFVAKDIEFGSGYFIFSFEEDTICHFNIKGIRGYKFGIWNMDDRLRLFWEYEKDIDKFKPTGVAYSFEIENEVVEQEVFDDLLLCKKHPQKSRVHGDLRGDWKHFKSQAKEKIKRNWLIIKAKLYGCEIVDRSRDYEGFIIHPTHIIYTKSQEFYDKNYDLSLEAGVRLQRKGN